MSNLFETIAHNLLNIEVNTIIKDSMTGIKMPAPRHLLIDIAQQYEQKLIAITGDPAIDENHKGVKLGGFISFDLIRTKAAKAFEEYKKKDIDQLSLEEKTDMQMLARIRDMSDQIKNFFDQLRQESEHTTKNEVFRNKRKELAGDENRLWEPGWGGSPAEAAGQTWSEKDFRQYDNNFTHLDVTGGDVPPLKINPEQLVLLRKIRELGTEIVVMQTVFQLDGDVLTRIRSEYADAKHSTLHEMHYKGLNTSLSYWKELAYIVRDFAKTLVEFFVGGSGAAR